MQTLNSPKNWYAFYTRPKLEKRISQDILEMNFENYLPLHTVFRNWSDRVKKMDVPMFPNYVFVKLDVKEKYKVLSVNGVVKIVSCQGVPVTVRETELDKIRKIETIRNDIAFEPFTCAGEKVLVTKGIFAGQEGELIKRLSGERLLIKLPSINVAVSISIPTDAVQKISRKELIAAAS